MEMESNLVVEFGRCLCFAFPGISISICKIWDTNINFFWVTAESVARMFALFYEASRWLLKYAGDTILFKKVLDPDRMFCY